jgi:hypothetical protein
VADRRGTRRGGLPRILVRGDTARNRVELNVAGETRQRAALSIARNYMDAVHEYYAALSFKAKVPLPDQPEVDVGYDYLVKLERDKGLDYTFPIDDAHREYSVGELLEGVRDVADELRREHPPQMGSKHSMNLAIAAYIGSRSP